MNTRSRLAVLAPLLALALSAVSGFGEWKAGVAAVKITPQKMIWMAGYAARTNGADRVEQDLFGKVLLLEGGNSNRVFLVTTDLIGVPRWLRDGLLERARVRWGTRPEGLLLNASHTHSGPELRTPREGTGGLPDERLKQAREYGAYLEDTLFGAMEAAVANLTTAKVEYARSRCGFAMNRRTPQGDGWANYPNPDGPVDHDVPVLKVLTPDRKVLRAVVFGYACHNTTLGFYYFSGDYAGYAQEYFERDHPGVTAMFMMGCGGDQNPYPRRSLDLAKRHGQSLATAVEAALETRAVPIRGDLKAAFADVPIRYARAPTRAELEERARHKDRYEAAHAKRLLEELDRAGKLPESYPCPVQVIHFGDALKLVAIGGEVVVDYSLRLKQDLGGHVWVAGYSNDVFGYLASRRVLKEGGYEGGGAMKYFTSIPHPGPWDESVEEIVVGAAYRLNQELAPESKSPQQILDPVAMQEFDSAVRKHVSRGEFQEAWAMIRRRLDSPPSQTTSLQSLPKFTLYPTWGSLAKKYKPAADRLLEEREELKKLVLGDGFASSSALYSVGLINRYLNEPADTIAFARTVLERKPSHARSAFMSLGPALFAAREFELLRRFIGDLDERFAHEKSMLERMSQVSKQGPPSIAIQAFVQRIGIIVETLKMTGEADKADALMTKARLVVPKIDAIREAGEALGRRLVPVP